MTHKPAPSKATAETVDKNVNDVDDVNEPNATADGDCDEPSACTSEVNMEPLPTMSRQTDGESDDVSVSGSVSNLNFAHKEHNNSSNLQNDANSDNVEPVSVSFQESVAPGKTELMAATTSRKRK